MLIENEKPEIYIALWDHSKYITLSSFCFMFPAIYAYYNAQHFYCIVLLLTSVISANYWRKATYSWRRNADLVFAKISFTVFVTNGIIHINYFPYVITGYSGLVILVYCYYLSGKLLEQKNNNWWKFHVLFHLIMMYEQFIILDNMNKNNKI